jgi:lipopolysaccharide/colanic/teichoic acid biosynthesis glycosyltransferase
MLVPEPHGIEANSLENKQSAASAGHARNGVSAVVSGGTAAYAVPVADIIGSSSWIVEAIYRILEIVIAAIGLTVGLPVMLLEAFLIRLDSSGPVLFFHTRPARSRMVRGCDLEGRLDLKPPAGGYDPEKLYYVPSYFRLVKFRTMYSDARSRFPELYAHNFAPEDFHKESFKHENDPRITRVGVILRNLSIDELPNLWCVLVGDMRLVGPRPEDPDVLRFYTPDEMYKFACKPGVTGLAQINGRGLLNWGETMAWDLKYVRTRSVWLDLTIILVTLKYVIWRRGAF